MFVIGLAVLGVFTLLMWFGGFLWNVAQYLRAILMPLFQPQEAKSLRERFGEWAVVTGSTDGIGKEYAKELAKQGINIILISRTEEKLVKVANEIESEFPVKTKIISADFSKGESVYAHIQEELEGLPVGILVNNVGKNYDYPAYLADVPQKDLWDIININVGAVTMMSSILLPSMKKRGKGAIVIVSSGSDRQPLPLMTVYAATKAYCRSFSTALRYEYKSDGIIVQHLAPYFISTKMNAFSDRLINPNTINVLVPDAKSYARQAVHTLGKIDSCTGCLPHEIQDIATGVSPVWIRTIVGARLNLQFMEDYKNKTVK